MSGDLVEVSSISRLRGFFPVALSTSRAWLGTKLSLQGLRVSGCLNGRLSLLSQLISACHSPASLGSFPFCSMRYTGGTEYRLHCRVPQSRLMT